MPFSLGANLPWIRYGTDFGANAWHPSGGVATSQRLDTELAQIADSGVRVVRWFLLCDGRAGIHFDESDVPRGLDGFVFADMDAALSAAARHHLRLMFVMFDFHWCQPAQWVNGVQLGGRRHVLRDPSSRAALFDNVVCPILERYGEESTIWAWDIMNEPEWVTCHLGGGSDQTALGQDELRAFLTETISHVHDLTSHPATVGSAGVRWRRFYEALDVDFHQVHWYESLSGQPPLETPVAALGFSRPVVLGEFPTRGSSRSVTDILDAARGAGYAAAFYWSALASDAATDRRKAKAGIHGWSALENTEHLV